MYYRKQILGINVDFGLDYTTAMSLVEQLITEKVPGKYICTTNPEFIIDALDDNEFKNIINNASLSVPDGSGLLYANAFLKRVEKISHQNKYSYALKTLLEGMRVGMSAIENPSELHSTITGVDLTNKLAALSAEKKYTMYLLGGRYGSDQPNRDMATDAAEKLAKLYPGINIVGATSKFSRNEIDDEATIKHIQNDMHEKGVSNIDILLVAYNHGFQDKWIYRNAHKIPATVSMGVGRTFALLSGYQPKEPAFLEKRNLSWLYRLFIQPSRIGRIYKAFPAFPIKVYLSNLKSSITLR